MKYMTDSPQTNQASDSEVKKIRLKGLKSETTGTGSPSSQPSPKKDNQEKKDAPQKNRWNVYALLFIISLIVVGLSALRGGIATESSEDISLSEFVTNFENGTYSSVSIRDHKVTGEIASDESKLGTKGASSHHQAILSPRDSLEEMGLDANSPNSDTKIEVIDTSRYHFWADLLPTLGISALFILLAIAVLSRMMARSGPMSFIKGHAKRFLPEDKKVLFKDVAGSVEEKEDLEEFVDFLKSPKKYEKLGAKIPRGVLMVGPPGTGKTLLARAVAGESNVPFFSISGSEFVEMFVGVGAARVRELFKEAKAQAPAIIFIDEIDAIGKKRSHGFGGGHDEREQTLNQILTEMDGFDNSTGVIVMGATNRADVLDRALLRPGRFDRKVTINMPNLKDREAILGVHARNKPLAKDINLHDIASATVGFSGADLENLLNEAAILAGRKKVKTITQAHLQQSIEKLVIGNTKKSLVMNEREKKVTAYHEVGHALVGKMTAHTDPVHKISIVSRGSAAGVTWYLPERDEILVSRIKLEERLATLFAGRASEEIFFGPDYITTGASSDIERATEIARDMVTRYGFDEQVGLENFAGNSVSDNHLGDTAEGKKVSDATHELIDLRVRKLLEDAYKKAKDIIHAYKDLHITISEKLIEIEEMDRGTFDTFFEGVSGVPDKIQ